MQEHDPTAVEPEDKPLEGGDQQDSGQADDVAEPSEPQEADLPKEETDVKESQQEPQDDSNLQTPQPDQAHPPVSEQPESD